MHVTRGADIDYAALSKSSVCVCSGRASIEVSHISIRLIEAKPGSERVMALAILHVLWIESSKFNINGIIHAIGDRCGKPNSISTFLSSKDGHSRKGPFYLPNHFPSQSWRT